MKNRGKDPRLLFGMVTDTLDWVPGRCPRQMGQKAGETATEYRGHEMDRKNEIIGRSEWGAFFGPQSDRERPPLGTGAFLSEKETPPMIAVPAESFNRFAEAMERIAQVVERLGPKEEVKEEPIERMLTPEEASKKMLLHPQTVTEWCREGKIRATKLGRKWLIPREEVERQIHAYEVKNGKKKGGAK